MKIAQVASFTKARTSWALETLLLAEANNMVSMRALNRWVSRSSVQAWNEA
ncbi:hypothetical protein D3C75_1372510 [compost metagenome]